jgi:UDP-4-amino-4,6-dideoxy-N-acetyl-beta-L-altrosamine N-acetyltransferase
MKDDLPMLLAWRNHPDVRRHMFTQHEISLAEHHHWFSKINNDPSYCLLIVEEAAEAIGYVQFSNVGVGAVANWGFYVRPDGPKGAGRKLGVIAINYAFGALRVHKVCGQAIESNQASIGFHKRLGFHLEGILREQQWIEGVHHSLYCFGMLSSEWKTKNQV